MIEQVRPHAGSITSIMIYCGMGECHIACSADLTTLFHQGIPFQTTGTSRLLCRLTARAACFQPWWHWESGPSCGSTTVRPHHIDLYEINTRQPHPGNCSISAFRALWASEHSVDTVVSLVQAINASGFNLDFESFSDQCFGNATGTAADALLMLDWLYVLRPRLHALNCRVSADVSYWSPYLSQYSVIAKGVDKLMFMGTYNAANYTDWMGYYGMITQHAGLGSAISIGLGWIRSLMFII